ncbi:MAG: hypothetical protein WBL61_17065, partial [Bryobacteraceae bacterium]
MFIDYHDVQHHLGRGGANGGAGFGRWRGLRNGKTGKKRDCAYGEQQNGLCHLGIDFTPIAASIQLSCRSSSGFGNGAKQDFAHWSGFEPWERR